MRDARGRVPVSYTHLDVYKRQVQNKLAFLQPHCVPHPVLREQNIICSSSLGAGTCAIVIGDIPEFSCFQSQSSARKGLSSQV